VGRRRRRKLANARMKSVMHIAVAAAQAGASVLKQGLEQDLEFHAKDGSRTSLVTSVDLQSQQEIVRVIQGAFPDHAIIGEEGNVGESRAESVWFVDPLDGTTNYMHKFPSYCVSIAHCDARGVGHAVVYDPFRNDLFIAERGLGAKHNGRPISVSGTSLLRDSLLSTQVQSDESTTLDRFAFRARRFVGAARALRIIGAPALALAYVARGWLDAYCETNMSPWDTLAGTLLVQEAGGCVTTFSGQTRPIGKHTSILASNAKLHDELLGILAVEEQEQSREAHTAETLQ
jgi:myo-inositol-1(or 4)-monophosphatase